MTIPKWSTPNRQTQLLKLWELFGNKCLLGHSVCDNPAHYAYIDTKAVVVGKAEVIPCLRFDGTPLLDSDGKQLMLTVYHPVKSYISQVEYIRLYDLKEREAIRDWKEGDRRQARLDWQSERKALHCLGETRQPLRGQFNNISRDIWHDKQPLFYLEGLGISGLTCKPFAKVKIGSSYMHLYIHLGDSLRGISKNRKRKAMRYNKPLPQEVQSTIAELVKLAVRDYLK